MVLTGLRPSGHVANEGGCFGRGVGLDDPQRSLPTPNILWFCEAVNTSWPLQQRSAGLETARLCCAAGCWNPAGPCRHPAAGSSPLGHCCVLPSPGWSWLYSTYTCASHVWTEWCFWGLVCTRALILEVFSNLWFCDCCQQYSRWELLEAIPPVHTWKW